MPSNKITRSLPLLSISVLRENTRMIVAQSRQLLQETEAIALGYTSSQDRNRLLDDLATARRTADSGAVRVQRQRRLVRELAAKGDDVRQAEVVLSEYEQASSHYWTEMEDLLDRLDRLDKAS